MGRNHLIFDLVNFNSQKPLYIGTTFLSGKQQIAELFLHEVIDFVLTKVYRWIIYWTFSNPVAVMKLLFIVKYVLLLLYPVAFSK